jgi:hypothetical protein
MRCGFRHIEIGAVSMLSLNPTAFFDALEKMGGAASLAAKYGPYYLGIILIFAAPFIGYALFKQSIGKTTTGSHYRNAYDDFRFYVRTTVVTGIFFVIVGVAWWLLASVWEVDNKFDELNKLKGAMAKTKYAIVGTFADPIPEGEEFGPAAITQPQSS